MINGKKENNDREIISKKALENATREKDKQKKLNNYQKQTISSIIYTVFI